jgi:hypothetical protein
MSPTSASGGALPGAPLEKIWIRYEQDLPGKYTGVAIAMFNPSQLRFSKEVSWRLEPAAGLALRAGFHSLQFQESKPRTLTVDLFFDTYEGPPAETSGLIGSALSALTPPPPGASAAVDVRDYTEPVTGLAEVDPELHRPPLCKLSWGKQQLIQGVLTHVGADYTFFLPNGLPVRATLNCSFTEARDAASALGLPELHSSDVARQWIVRPGDTLQSIALATYNDATQWRVIARRNRIENPRHISPGQVLIIPPLREA